jgi:hypothetical protein
MYASEPFHHQLKPCMRIDDNTDVRTRLPTISFSITPITITRHLAPSANLWLDIQASITANHQPWGCHKSPDHNSANRSPYFNNTCGRIERQTRLLSATVCLEFALSVIRECRSHEDYAGQLVHDASHFTFHVGRCREWEMVDAFMPLAKYSSKYIKDPSLLLLVVFVSVRSHSSSSSFPSHLFPGLRREPYFFLSTEDSVYMFGTRMMTAPDENLFIQKRSMAP